MTEAEQIIALQEQVATLQQALAEAMALVVQLQARVVELEAQLRQDSHNSHWPPSRDKQRSGRQEKRQKSLRRSSGQKPGGQPGHSGKTLKLVAEPDTVVVHAPDKCGVCGLALPPVADGRDGVAVAALCLERRQVFDLTPVRLQVTEHRCAAVCCPGCGCQNWGVFPAAVNRPVQYGPQVRALAVELHEQQMVSLQRLRTFLGQWLQAPIAPASILRWVQEAAAQAAPQLERIRAGLRRARVVHCDETGHYVAGRRGWLHVAATAHLTCYAPHASRGRVGMAAMGILPDYSGTVVHDGFPAYAPYACRHALCNVHHLRELTAVHEQAPETQGWALALKQWLYALHAEVATAREQEATTLTPLRRTELDLEYSALLSQALQANPPPPGGWPHGARGRPRKPKALNLAERLLTQRQAVLAFVDDFAVPFDNNLVERDIRMVKVQQKVAGCFRSWNGAQASADLRSYLSTLVKQGHTTSHALLALFSGSPIPVAMPE